MNEKSFKDLTAQDVAKLKFKHELCNYVLSTSNGNRVETLYRIEKESYQKIIAMFEGKEGTEINAGDKVYLLPGQTLAKSRLIEHIKSLGATVTQKVTSATVIVGSEDFTRWSPHMEKQPMSHLLMMNIESYYRVHTNEADKLAETFKALPQDFGLEMDYDNGIPVVISQAAKSRVGFDINVDGRTMTDETEDRHYFVKAHAMEIIYCILSKKLNVIPERIVRESANSDCSLADDDNFNTIKAMLKGDEADQELGTEILLSSDLKGDAADINYKLYQLAKLDAAPLRGYGAVSKSLQYFFNTTHYTKYRGYSAEDFLEHCAIEKHLNKQMIEDLMPEVTKEYHDRFINEEYDERAYQFKQEGFTITFTLKPVYQEALNKVEDETPVQESALS